MRRALVIAGVIIILSVALLFSRPPNTASSQTPQTLSQLSAQPSGYVLQWDEGERRILGNRRAPLNIKVSPKTGSQHLTMGTEQIAPA